MGANVKRLRPGHRVMGSGRGAMAATYPLTRASEAFALLRAKTHFGKIAIGLSALRNVPATTA